MARRAPSGATASSSRLLFSPRLDAVAPPVGFKRSTNGRSRLYAYGPLRPVDVEHEFDVALAQCFVSKVRAEVEPNVALGHCLQICLYCSGILVGWQSPEAQCGGNRRGIGCRFEQVTLLHQPEVVDDEPGAAMTVMMATATAVIAVAPALVERRKCHRS